MWTRAPRVQGAGRGTGSSLGRPATDGALADPMALSPDLNGAAPKNLPLPNRRGRAPDSVDYVDLNWSDFMFNLISMCIVYAYFSKAVAQNESVAAVLLCMGVAAFDIVLLLMRWLWCGSWSLVVWHRHSWHAANIGT